MRNDPLIEILKKNFAQKKERNRAYSLRSYSRDLGLDPSNLSKIMSYQKLIGPSLRKKLGKRMGFQSSEIESFLRPADHTKTSDSVYSSHTFQVFQLVSEWQHYAILEVFKLKDFSQKVSWIADRLGLTPELVKESIQRLLEAGLLVQTGKQLRLADESSSSILQIATSKAHREQQRQILEGSIDALEAIPIELRSQSSMTMAIDTDKIGAAKELIKNFRRDIGRLLSSSSELNEVYQLSVSLYPVTKTKPGEKK